MAEKELRKAGKQSKEEKLRTAIINEDKRKPKKCHLECSRICPKTKEVNYV